MAIESDVEKLKAQLAACEGLAAELRDGSTARNIQELTEEIEQQLQAALRATGPELPKKSKIP